MTSVFKRDGGPDSSVVLALLKNHRRLVADPTQLPDRTSTVPRRPSPITATLVKHCFLAMTIVDSHLPFTAEHCEPLKGLFEDITFALSIMLLKRHSWSEDDCNAAKQCLQDLEYSNHRRERRPRPPNQLSDDPIQEIDLSWDALISDNLVGALCRISNTTMSVDSDFKRVRTLAARARQQASLDPEGEPKFPVPQLFDHSTLQSI